MRMELPQDVRNVLSALEQAGYGAWCVGGCVRDTLLGRAPGDWDVTTSARPEETMRLFGAAALPTGLRHGTVTVRTPQRSVEITTYRSDGPYADHRHPDSVTFSQSVEEDLSRRDFTVNAIALSAAGRLCDPFGGQKDLETQTLRCVGDPALRFQEDALRILRGLRFASVLGFSLEPNTAAAARNRRELLGCIAPERIRTELEKLLCGHWAGDVLRAFPDVIGVVLPEILPTVGFNQRNRHHCYDIWEHTTRSVDRISPEPVLRMTMLLHDLGKPRCFTVDEHGCGHFYGHPALSRDLAAGILSRLRTDNRSRDDILTLVEWHDRSIPRTEKGVRRALRALGEENLRRLLRVKRADNLAQAPEFYSQQEEIRKAEQILDKLLREDSCWSLRQLAVNGDDLLNLGFSGPELGRELNTLLDAVVDGDLLNDKTALLQAARQQKEGASQT